MKSQPYAADAASTSCLFALVKMIIAIEKSIVNKIKKANVSGLVEMMSLSESW